MIDEELIFGLGLGIIGTERYHLFGQVIVSDRFGLDNHLLFGLGIFDEDYSLLDYKQLLGQDSKL